jgi:hypothetical protein
MHYNWNAVWHRRFADDGINGLVDGQRPGRIPVFGNDDVLVLLKTVTETPPNGATRWTMAAITRG